VAGAVMLSRGGDTSVTPASGPAQVAETRSVADEPVKQLVPRTGTLPGRNDAHTLVSLGGGAAGSAGTPAGAIDESKTEATIDSLIAVDVMRMSPQERALYIKRRIDRLNLHLQRQQKSTARP
jgi:hypothetical protein